jgi:hypothetical protein
MEKAKIINNDMLNLKNINITKHAKEFEELLLKYNIKIKPSVRDSRTTKTNEHLFKPKSFKPTKKTMMAHALEFGKWLETSNYVWRQKYWLHIETYKRASDVKVYKEFLAENN